MNILIVVTHLLGTGHLARALTLARAFHRAGHVARVASGGMPVPQLDHSDVDLLQLPPLRSDGSNFTHLLDTHGNRVDAKLMAARQAALIDTLAPAPDIIITELFPFGRRILSDEFLRLLDGAKTLPRSPIILASVRDILAPPSKPSKAIRAEEIIARYYDGILVHTDPSVITLEKSWPVSDTVRPKLIYTGYVAPAAPKAHSDKAGQGEILVSAGGGIIGMPLYELAIKAARKLPNHRWRLLVAGGKAAPARIAALLALNPPDNALIQPARPDFRQMLLQADASVSMCGYNTTLDLLQAGTPAVVVPFDDGHEVEQTLRAQSLRHMPALKVRTMGDLTADSLCEAVIQVINEGPRKPVQLKFDGAQKTVKVALKMAEVRA